MTDRRSRDRRSERRFLFRDCEVIVDLHFKNDRKVIAIAKFDDRDLAIARSLLGIILKINSFQNN